MNKMQRSTGPEIARRSLLKAVPSAIAPVLLAGMTAQADDASNSSRASEKDFRSHLLNCLGGPWPQLSHVNDLAVRTEAEPMKKDGYTLEHISFAAVGDPVEPADRVPAFVLIPDGVSAAKPAPAIAVWHQHAGQYQNGKAEPAGLAGSAMHQTAVALAREGYVVICPDALCFGERQDATGKLKRGDDERYQFLRYTIAGKCLAWKDILDMKRTIDYLASRPEVLPDRIGCYGHSMGSTHTWMVGPWEPRLRCLVGNCCLPTYKAIERDKILHCFENFIPGLGQFGDTPDIVAQIAPRRLHMNFGETDSGSPIDEVRRALKIIEAAYAKAGAADRFTSFIEPATGHVLSDAMWLRVKECFAKELRK
jgi:dienelactone hydrolase